MLTLHEMTTNSRRDHKATCPGCWEAAMRGVAACEYRRDEAEALVEACVVKADTAVSNDILPGWLQIMPMIRHALEQHNSGMQKAVPYLPGLLQKMGKAANQTK